MLQTALHYSHHLLKQVLQPGDYAIDGTIGNGNDTQLLAELVGESGHVYGFDIQAQALASTTQRLTDNGLTDRVTLSLAGHQNIAALLPETLQIKAAVFNLGYLPKSDKQIITLPATTKTALEACLVRLLPQGRIIIVAYYGHPGGQDELNTITRFCEQLPQEQYTVLQYQFINQKNQPPMLFCIEKKRRRSPK